MEHDESLSVWPPLISGAMFDVKTPLHVVHGYARMLELEKFGPITEQQRRAVQAIQEGVRTIRELVNALDGLASLHGSGWRVEMTAISLRQLLSEVGSLQIGEAQGSIDVGIQAEHDQITGALALVRRALIGLVRVVAFGQLNGKRPLSIWIVDSPRASELWVVLAATDQIAEAVRTPRESLSPLRWTPPGLSMDLPFASAIVQAHGGQLLALPAGLPGMVVALPKLSAT